MGAGGDSGPFADGAPFRPFQLADSFSRPGRGDTCRLGTPRFPAEGAERGRHAAGGEWRKDRRGAGCHSCCQRHRGRRGRAEGQACACPSVLNRRRSRGREFHRPVRSGLQPALGVRGDRRELSLPVRPGSRPDCARRLAAERIRPDCIGPWPSGPGSGRGGADRGCSRLPDHGPGGQETLVSGRHSRFFAVLHRSADCQSRAVAGDWRLAAAAFCIRVRPRERHRLDH